MRRKISILLTFVLLVCAMSIPAYAAEEPAMRVQTIQTQQGEILIETTLTIEDVQFYSESKRASKKQVYKHNGDTIAEVVLTATFGYDGDSAWVISTDSSHTTYSGWSYGHERITESGNRAKLTAKLTYPGDSVSVNLSMTCTPSGQIS